MVAMDYSKLLGRMKEKGYTQKTLAEEAGMAESQLCCKLSGKYGFKQGDIHKLCGILDIEAMEIGAFFFKAKS